MVKITNNTIAKILILVIFVSIGGYAYSIQQIENLTAPRYVQAEQATGGITTGNVTLNIQPAPAAEEEEPKADVEEDEDAAEESDDAEDEETPNEQAPRG